MPMPTFAVISVAAEGLLMLFHLSMFLVIAYNVIREIKPFSTAFYKIYLAQCVADYMIYAWSSLFGQLQLFNVINSTAFDVQAVGVAQYFIGGCDFNFIYFSYLTIAFNRYTAILRPFQHAQIWTSRRMTKFLATSLVLAASLASIRLFFVIKALPMDSGYFLANVDRWKGMVSGYISAGTCVVTCLCTLLLNVHTYLAYRKLSQQRQQACREEYHLLIYALTHLVGQVLMSIWYVVYYTIAPNVPFYMNMMMMYVMNVICLGGPVCLFITSGATRQAYFKMYFAFAKSSLVFTSRTVASNK